MQHAYNNSADLTGEAPEFVMPYTRVRGKNALELNARRFELRISERVKGAFSECHAFLSPHFFVRTKVR